jgi:hypothetical protein
MMRTVEAIDSMGAIFIRLTSFLRRPATGGRVWRRR